MNFYELYIKMEEAAAPKRKYKKRKYGTKERRAPEEDIAARSRIDSYKVSVERGEPIRYIPRSEDLS